MMRQCFCGKEAIAKDLCWVHYQRQRRTGTVEYQKPTFWDRVDRSCGENACWPWLGSITGPGYGHLTVTLGYKQYKSVYSHRIAWELTHGKIRDCLTVDHLCRNTICCNPAHMRLVTLRENLENRSRPVRQRSKNWTCSHRDKDGRILEAHRYTSPKGAFYCRSCQRERYRVWQNQRRERVRTYQAGLRQG
jgi:hypothetical protein